MWHGACLEDARFCCALFIMFDNVATTLNSVF